MPNKFEVSSAGSNHETLYENSYEAYNHQLVEVPLSEETQTPQFPAESSERRMDTVLLAERQRDLLDGLGTRLEALRAGKIGTQEKYDLAG